MPIKGIIRVIFPGDPIKNMQIGTVCYLNAQDIILTKDALFIDVDSEIFLNDEIIDDSFILVKRIGEGLASNDFELDFTGLNKETFFDIENDSLHVSMFSEAGRFIIFKNVDYVEVFDLDKEKISPLEEKRLELKIALDLNDYEKAAIIRDEISKLEDDEGSSVRKEKKA